MAEEPSVTDLLAEVRNEIRIARTIPSTAIVLRQRAVDQAVEYILSDPRFDNVQVTLHNPTPSLRRSARSPSTERLPSSVSTRACR